ncbi:MAG: oligosaccharyl transferase, archaeosortase A system-associated [Coxiellaceae bacterium]|jgi:dolichyl-diphosphooligosaccharide--protein glycosyltransferase|nr:oligosaccharyl transferase, archaeosortase A system-associated [Coxiellaceae bacterium]
MDLLNKKFKIIPEDNYRQILILVVFGIAMFFIRTVPNYHLIFTNWLGEDGTYINFSADDAVYHMRLVHNTIHHFPWRIPFDPFTHFPFGNQIHFGPIFTLIITTVALIIGFGKPTPELINIVGAYTPVIMGILCLIPVYFISRKFAGKTSTIISAFILTFLPGTFLQRSSLGFTDHHVAEVLFSSTTIVFLVYALDKSKHFLRHCILTLAGITFGLFILVWPAALMFGVIFLIFFITQLLIDHLRNRFTDYLLPLAIAIYSIPTIMSLPYALRNPQFELAYYSLTQPVILITMLGLFTTCYIVHRICIRHQLAKDLYPIILSVILTLIFFTISYQIPKLFTMMCDGCKMLFEPTPAMKTISEVHPSILNSSGNKYSIEPLWYNYFWAMPFATIGLGHLCYTTYKNACPKEVLLLIWTIVIILAALTQCRFNYYLAINVAILAGCYSVTPFFNFLSDLTPRNLFDLRIQKITIYILFCFFVFIIIDPILMLLIDKNIPRGLQVSNEWYNTYIWLKKHTPDPQGKIIHQNFNYASGYYPILKDSKLPYKYPKSAYGIMAWWEIGHQLTYIAKRIPNTNPFQQGIIEKDKAIGAAPFFTSTDENKAVANLDAMGSRYIILDHKTASNIERVGVWCKDINGWTKSLKIKLITTNKKTIFTVPVDAKKFLQSMLNRLYYADTNGLKHFRLIYESDGNYLVSTRKIIFKSNLNTITSLSFKNYRTAIKNTTIINRMLWANKAKTALFYQARPPIKRIKIFEKVKGAIISGEAPRNTKEHTKIKLVLKLKTKFNRIFTYEQTSIVTNGKYKFIVPYPTTLMKGDNYSYDIKPLGPYEIKIGTVTAKISVPEDAVILGKNIKINIFNLQ